MFVLCLLWTALATPTVAIADLANQTGDPAFDGAGPGVAGVLVSRFQGSGAVQVVERDALEALLVEQRLGIEGLADPRTAARAGRLAGADFLVVGELFSVKLPTLSIALRVIDTDTGEVVLARDVVGDVGEDGSRFFELLDTLSAAILEGMRIAPDARGELSAIEQRELDAVLRYGEDLLRVNLDHPMALYRESDRDFDRDAYEREYWQVYDRRGNVVEMPEFARRVGDRPTQRAFLERGRTLRKKTVLHNVLVGAYGVAGLSVYAVGSVMGGGTGEQPGASLQLAGVGVFCISGIHLGLNVFGQAAKRRKSRMPSTYYSPAEADRWIHTYNRSLGDP